MSDLDRSVAFTALLNTGHLKGKTADEGSQLVTWFLQDYWMARAGGLTGKTMYEFAGTWGAPDAAKAE